MMQAEEFWTIWSLCRNLSGRLEKRGERVTVVNGRSDQDMKKDNGASGCEGWTKAGRYAVLVR